MQPVTGKSASELLREFEAETCDNRPLHARLEDIASLLHNEYSAAISHQSILSARSWQIVWNTVREAVSELKERPALRDRVFGLSAGHRGGLAGSPVSTEYWLGYKFALAQVLGVQMADLPTGPLPTELSGTTIRRLIQRLQRQPHIPPCLLFHERAGAECSCWRGEAVEFLEAALTDADRPEGRDE